MQGKPPEINVVDGRLNAPSWVPLIWLPRDGKVIAKIPARKGNRHWLQQSVRVRSPRFESDRWILPRNCTTRLVIAATDRYGQVVVCRDMTKLSRCTQSCLDASGFDCDCSCLGLHHGENGQEWFNQLGDVAVADLGETKRSFVTYTSTAGDSAEPVIYGGELFGKSYRADNSGRAGWPPAARFMCASCLTARARVWDHCHEHNFVRAPLCNTCNTRHWRGWHPQYGRAAPSSNLDASYYSRCPRYSDTHPESHPCSP